MIKLVPDNISIDFLSKRHICALLSAALLAATIALLAIKGLNYGIDFAGGTLVQIQTEKQPDVSDVRGTLKQSGFEGFSIQTFDGSADEFLIKVPVKEGVTSKQVSEDIVESLNAVAGTIDVRRVEFVGPQVGDELKVKGLIAMGLSMLAILIYISVRFEMRYAVGAIAALMHDVLLTVGVFALLQKEVTLAVLAALLTIIGYSLNDTIVVFDRVRENLRKHSKKPMVEMLNLSVNEMLNRTLMTSLTTVAVLLALFFLGGGVIHDFAFTLLFGVLVGTYSSVFIAAPVVQAMDGYYKRLAEAEEKEKTGNV